jgi:hypothetical protein
VGKQNFSKFVSNILKKFKRLVEALWRLMGNAGLCMQARAV